MPHNYKTMPPLWRVKELLELSDEHPSGLAWLEGDSFVERKDKTSGYYLVSIDNAVYHAHRVVYYLRTNECPDRYAVTHDRNNKTKDNRQELNACWIPRKRSLEALQEVY